MKKIVTILAAASLYFAVSLANAHEHETGTITGPGIQLFERGHGFAGELFEFPAYGAFEHNPFGGKIQFRRDGKNLTLEFTKTGTQYSGLVSEARTDKKTGEPVTVQTSVQFAKIEKVGDRDAILTLLLDEKPLNIRILGRKFSDGHFQHPRFETVIGGKEVKFDFTGEACFGYSTNLSMMIFGVAAHLMKN